ncbi:MAG: thiamine pyrophosphate-dependent enzyme [Xanthomonadales bacterium]|jgi:pyruvate ferredoxin oxidoreductase alpha subunit|nr:thiamine pyrophosphate-dependent enzyme [Xanthomonadales bacterium]MDH3923568.1 thiamine pyrophosphate-dependent enzyme [Xanthomonadales bacterium]MDH4001936.1 thiamine pyrophosphate-dependent enzyme [Xanthomonadales bacterium]
MATEIHAVLQDQDGGNTAGVASQSTDFLSGNEAAARAARDIGFHVMGYFPITPSTEVAETLSKMQAAGEHEIMMIPADGEHGAAGICYGAALGGGRVLNATSSQGLLYALEQLPVQSSTRVPMVLNVATRAISGPLDIRCDHSDIYFALNTGWIILLAREPQAVYDMNLAAIRIGEHADVRLPVLVAYDGFFTSHQKRRVEVIEDKQALQEFLGTPETPFTALDPRHPVTFGPYMNDPDLINNKKQHSLAMEAARQVIPEVFEELEKLTGRRYPVMDSYHMEDAEVALVLLNSAAETAKEVADRLRGEGKKVGVLSLNMLRPFPTDLIRQALSGVKAIVVGDRADSYGADGGNLSLEVRAAIQVDPDNRTRVLTRIYGLGGKDFDDADAEEFFNEALETAETGEVKEVFAYHGTYAGDPDKHVPHGLPAIEKGEVTRGMATVTENPETGKLNVELKPLWAMAEVPSRIAPGHGACPGCGAFPVLHQVFSVLEGDVVVLFQTGCAMVVTTGYPKTAHRITYIHNLFQNGAATLSGLVEMYHELLRRGELPDSPDITFVMVTGDGGMDIGMGSALGAAHRNHHMMILEYDNQGYMNTGAQLSYSTPLGHRTSTSEVGSKRKGKVTHHKDTPQIFSAAHVPYVFTASEGYPEDLMRKAAKAQWYAKNEGMTYGKILSFCPLNWTTTDDAAESVLQVAIDSCFFPIYEVERGITNITYDPEVLGRRRKITEWLGRMGKTKHLMAEGNEQRLAAIEEEAERRWRRIKAMHEHPEL